MLRTSSILHQEVHRHFFKMLIALSKPFCTLDASCFQSNFTWCDGVVRIQNEVLSFFSSDSLENFTVISWLPSNQPSATLSVFANHTVLFNQDVNEPLLWSARGLLNYEGVSSNGDPLNNVPDSRMQDSRSRYDI
jgi:hypothetical protein